MDGWTADEERHMAQYRGESIDDPRPGPDQDELDEREAPEQEEMDRGVPAEVAALLRRPTSRARARARLGRRDCIICAGEQCWCAVADRLAALTCGHAGTGICRGCLAEFLVLSERGSAAGADFQARRLVAAQRLRRRRSAA